MRSRNLIAVVCAVGAALTVSAGTALADTTVADPHTIISFNLPPTDTSTNVSVCDYSSLSGLESHFATSGDASINTQIKTAVDNAVVSGTSRTGAEAAFNYRRAFCSSSKPTPTTSSRPRPIDRGSDGSDNGPDNGTVSCDDAQARQRDAFVRLNDAIARLNDVDAQVVKDSGGDPARVSASDQQRVRDASRAENTRQLEWQRARNHRISVCRDSGGDDVTRVIVVKPAPAGTTYVSAPSSGVVSRAPKGAPETGDASLAGELR